MTSEMTVRDADNGMMVEGEDFAYVFEDTHIIKGVDKDNLIYNLGKLFYEDLTQAMEQEMSSKVRVKMEITKIE